MGEKGFSLVELLVTLGVAVLLLSIATMKFGEMNRKAAIEEQMRMLHTDLMEVRQKALFEKTPRAVQLAHQAFSTYAGGSVSGTPTLNRSLPYSISWSSGGDPLVVVFDTYGVAGVTAPVCICVDPAQDNPASIDSLIISQTKIDLGKRDSGGSCAESAISRK